VGNNTTGKVAKVAKVQAALNGMVVSVIDCAVGQPVGAAILASAKVVLRGRRPQTKEPQKLAAKV